MTPAELLKQARYALGLTVERFAALVGTSGRTVRRWENGTLDIDKRVLPVIEHELIMRRVELSEALHALRLTWR